MKTKLTVLLFAALTVTAFADQFSLSYLFSPNATNQREGDIAHSFTATFDGTQDGNFVTINGGLSVMMDGLLAPHARYASGIAWAAGLVNGGITPNSVLSFDASLNNFLFADDDIGAGRSSYSWFFGMIDYGQGVQSMALNFGYGSTTDEQGNTVNPESFHVWEDANPDGWSLVNLSQQNPAGRFAAPDVQSVPDAGWSALLLAVGMVAIAGVRRVAT